MGSLPSWQTQLCQQDDYVHLNLKRERIGLLHTEEAEKNPIVLRSKQQLKISTLKYLTFDAFKTQRVHSMLQIFKVFFAIHMQLLVFGGSVFYIYNMPYAVRQ